MSAPDPAVRHLYVHVPFCPTICPFCSFEVTERRAGLVDRYLAELDRHAAELVDRYHPPALDTVYLGGGTPSYLRDDELLRLTGIVRARFGWAPEVTLELHPSTVTAARVALWRDLGFSRLSVGVESTDDEVLRRLGRSHDARTALAALDLALDSGLEVSADVMSAIEGQDVAADLAAVAATGVPHVSAYVLTIEEGTPFDRDGVEVDAEAELAALTSASTVLGAAGLSRYEVSNHARPGHECAHNLAYWDNDWWFGLGPGASSHLPARGDEPGADDGGGRVVGGGGDGAAVAWRVASPDLGRWLDGDRGDGETRDAAGYLADGVLAGLRRTAGVDLAALGRRVGVDGPAHVADALAEVTAAGLARFDGSVLAATDAGAVVLDRVAAAFV